MLDSHKESLAQSHHIPHPLHKSGTGAAHQCTAAPIKGLEFALSLVEFSCWVSAASAFPGGAFPNLRSNKAAA